MGISGTNTGKTNKRISALSLTLQDCDKAYNLTIPPFRENKKGEIGTSIEKL